MPMQVYKKWDVKCRHFYYFCLISSYESSVCKPCFRNHDEFFENTIAITILVLRPSLVT